MGKKALTFIILFMVSAVLIFAGDIAQFVNLGFSKNGGYFMFAQYGVAEKGNKPYADLFLVKVSTNSFARGGVIHISGKSKALPGDTGEGALYTIIEKSISLKEKYGIDHFNRGRILYILMNGEEPKEKIGFRDFQGKKNYTIRLIQSSSGKGKDIRSSFYLDVNIVTINNDLTRHFQVGLPDYQRKGVKRYRLRQILMSPDEKSLIFIIEKEEVDEKGSNIRYMVEALSLKQ